MPRVTAETLAANEQAVRAAIDRLLDGDTPPGAQCDVKTLAAIACPAPGWRVGRRFYTIHATFAGAPAVQELAAKARDRLVRLPGLDLIPGQWLHLTMQGIGFADEVSDSDLSAIITAVKGRVWAVPPITVAIGPPVVAGGSPAGPRRRGR